MKDFTLEVCVDSVESALAAQRGGADRLELCGNLIIGGTTPGPCLFREVRRHCRVKIHVLIRPRYGDFCYTEQEFRIMKEEVGMFRQLGADGIVIGCLKPDGTLDREQMRELMEEAKGMSVTLHRAFDVCRDPYEALEQAKELGIDTILTSGQANGCLEGKETLAKLVRQAAGEIDILVGSGVDAETILAIAREVGACSYHMSGKVTAESRMQYRKEGVYMGLPCFCEYEIWRTSEEKVRAAAGALQQIRLGTGLDQTRRL